MDMMKMMKQAAGMQKEMKKKQKKLAAMTVEFESAGGAVCASMSCDLKAKSLRIDPELIAEGDVRKIESAVLDAFKGVLKRAQDEAANEMKSITSGLNLPF